MKTIQITNYLYDKLKAVSDEQDEDIAVVACLYISQGMKIFPQLQDENKSLKDEKIFNQAVNESNQLTKFRRH